MERIMTQVHIADIHFGCIDPQKELEILTNQFLNPISRIQFDILAIDGDLFDRRFSANNPAVAAAIEFVNRCAMLCAMRSAALIMISGTESHEAGQLSLFQDLGSTTGCEMYIVNAIQFVHTHNVKILCIPEEYGKGMGYYENYLKQTYDYCFMHGTLVGGIIGANQERLDGPREPVFSIDSFSGCKGPIISGHVHTAMCLNSYMYYLSSPIRYRFGEEGEKGYAIVLSNLDTHAHYYQFMPIQSFRYDTIGINQLASSDPNQMIKELEQLQANGIDYLRLDCSGLELWKQQVLSKFVHENRDCHIKLYNTTREKEDSSQIADGSVNTTEGVMEKLRGMEFLLDEKIDPLTKFVLYLNFNEGSQFISIEKLKEILGKT